MTLARRDGEGEYLGLTLYALARVHTHHSRAAALTSDSHGRDHPPPRDDGETACRPPSDAPRDTLGTYLLPRSLSRPLDPMVRLPSNVQRRRASLARGRAQPRHEKENARDRAWPAMARGTRRAVTPACNGQAHTAVCTGLRSGSAL